MTHTSLRSLYLRSTPWLASAGMHAASVRVLVVPCCASLRWSHVMYVSHHPQQMKHMVALTHEYVNSAAAAAAYAGDVECLNLAVKLAGEASGQSVDIVRVLMSLAAGGHKELFRERVKSRELRAVRPRFVCVLCVRVCVVWPK